MIPAKARRTKLNNLEENTTIQVGFIGLNNQGQQYLEALSSHPLYRVSSIADLDIERAERLSRKFECDFFDDFRQLILTSKIDLLIDSTNNQTPLEIIILALKNRISVLKTLHVGPSFEDFGEILKASLKYKTLYTVASTLAYSPGFSQLRKYLAQDNSTEEIYLLSVYGAYPIEMQLPENRWLSDPEIACGGVLMHKSYEILQEIIRNFDLPEQVYALTTNLAPDKRQQMSLTEDAAILSMNFRNKLIGTLEASRVASPANEYLKIYYPDKCITATKSRFVITDASNNILQETSGPSDNLSLINLLLDDFANAISGQTKEHNYFLKRELSVQTSAIIQASYLSFRTLMPENPQKISEITTLDSKPIW